MAVISLPCDVIENITEEQVKKIIKNNTVDVKYDNLMGYYKGEHGILNETKSSASAPNNKIVANMSKYITDTATGYFIGKPIVYSSQNTEFLKELQEIFDYNDEQDENAELAKDCSVYGHCFEMLYIDEDSKIRFQKLAPQNVIMIYDSSSRSPIAAIRMAVSMDLDNKAKNIYEFWNSSEVWLFTEDGDNLALTDASSHYFGDVPFVEYVNNAERTGDFESVRSENDAYNKSQSNSANIFQYNDEAILKITKIGEVSKADIKEMKEDGAIILDQDGDISWLLKTIDDNALENYKNRLREDMHIFSSVPNLTDDAFGGNLSGVAVSYKLWGLEQLCAMKERKFKKGLQRRIELIAAILKIYDLSSDYMDIKMQFRRNKPQNVLEIAQIIQTLTPDLSRETRLKMLPIVEDVQDEIQKLQKEQQAELANYGGYENLSDNSKVASNGDE